VGSSDNFEVLNQFVDELEFDRLPTPNAVMLYLIIMLAFVFFASVAMCVNEGLWSNTIGLASVLVCGTSAILFGVPLGTYVAAQAKASDETVWAFVFGIVWLVFAASILVFRLLAEKVSGVRMKFVPQLDMIAGPLMGLLLAVMFTSFSALTLLRIPITAGQWDLPGASGWQRNAMLTVSAPFYTVVKRYAQADGAKSSLVSK